MKPAVGTAVFPFSDGLKPLQGYLNPTLANTPPHRNTPMKTYFYNKNINCIEVQPAFIRTAMRQAKRYRCGIRILSRPTVVINPPPAPKHAVVDFADLAAYPELPHLQIGHDLESPEFINTDALYRFEQLDTMVIGQPIDIDLSQLPALKDLRLDYHKKIRNIGQCTRLERLYLWSYKGKDLTEFQNLTRLKDLLLVRSSVCTLNGIENLTALETIDISYARSLNDISALHRLQEKHQVRNIGLPEKFHDEEFGQQ